MDILQATFGDLALPPAAVQLFRFLALASCGTAGGSLAFAALQAAARSRTGDGGAEGVLASLGALLARSLRWDPAGDGRLARWQAWHELEDRPLSIPFLLGLAAALGLAGLAVGSILSPLGALLVGLLGAGAYPLRIWLRVNGQMTEFRRGLPSSIILLLAEHKAGASIEGSLAQLAERPGPMARFLADALTRTRQGDEPLFSRGEHPGVLTRRARLLGLPELMHLVHTLESVENQGRAANQVMQKLNDLQVVELNKQAVDSINALERRLVVLIAVFFLFPILGLLLMSLMVPLFDAF